MTQPLFQPRVYAGVDERSVRADLVREGWNPLVFADPPGTVYPPHRHPETKLLAFLVGSMDVRVGGKTYHCAAGDKLVIPGSTEHAALVGPEGCAFFWSEQVRDSR